jgi:uncharacterized membrane protein
MNQTDILDEKARDIIQNRILKGMIGPGSDIWGVDDDEEIISDYPLQRYFSGILFPDKIICRTLDEEESASAESKASVEGKETNEENIERTTDDEVKLERTTNPNDDELKISQNNYFPTNIGLSVALKKEAEYVDASFSFGLYYQPKQTEIKIKIPQAGYDAFFEEKIPVPLAWREILKYENGFMFLERELNGEQSKPEREFGEYGQFDKFRHYSNLKRQTEEGGYFSAYYYINYLEKLISRVWKRKDVRFEIKIPIKSTEKPQLLDLEEGIHSDTKVGYNVKVYPSNNASYIKVQLVNLSERHASNRFSNKSEPLNKKCLFQSSIRIKSKHIIEYKDQSVSTYYTDSEIQDNEAEEIEFIYRDVQSYGVGHNCSARWNDDHSAVDTTFLPEQNIRDVINEFDDNTLDDCLDIRNLSFWGLPKKEVIVNMTRFVKSYKDWIDKQITESEKLSKDEIKIANRLIDRQQEIYYRLEKNIELLINDNVFRAFQIANTAMLIQMITSKDVSFNGEDGKKGIESEKELSNIRKDVDFNSLDFFRNYPFGSDDRIKESPKYRPFQLAFFIISIEEIVKPEKRSEKNIVDLIWFPTGGGKTEAYLAVAAFTIVFRRISHKTGFGGTTVIMRYTLRLLTAQQFERASRLISSLEFLRQQKEFQNDLKAGEGNEINIGLWVGQASTPNTILGANQLLDGDRYGMEAEALKGDNGDPHKYNEFQVSSCPWCGTKIISKEKIGIKKEIWKYGFKSKRNDFIIHCLNPKCIFHKRIPIQVVDEVLYNSPPTLLFGTVDKFAMLAWQEEAHNYFKANTDNGLPPELIIQDELHLLNGPLGSITGLFESTIELLCTKNGVGPKIISSTATTRNTDIQIKRLYGNRKVNVFPPSGISYDDSFFAKENKESKRRYIGFMQTGKTAVDTQLQILAHLLVSRLEVFKNKDTKERTDLYWTIVSYYNSLKDVGKIYNKVGDEVSNFTSTLQYRLSQLFQPFDEFTFNFNGIAGRTEELTSRVESAKIKSILKEIEKPFQENKIVSSERGIKYLNDVVDFVLATNMISVGIDISRLNIIVLNGMPKNIAEYIQASSRVGRKTKGIVITLLDPNRAREKSFFEHFINFHSSFYKCVEPISITPFTENTIDKMLTTTFVSYIRNMVPAMSKNDAAKYFEKGMAIAFKEFITKRFNYDSDIINYFNERLDELIDDWQKRASLGSKLTYKALLKRPTERQDEGADWATMQSMREIDTDTFVEIKSVY